MKSISLAPKWTRPRLGALLIGLCYVGLEAPVMAFPLSQADLTAAVADVNVKATIAKSPTVGDNNLKITISDSKGAAIKNAKATISVAMSSMDMGTTRPKVTNHGDGTYGATVNFSMAGPWRVTVKVEAPGHKSVTKNFDFQLKPAGKSEPMDMGMPGMEMGSMLGHLGPWGMAREGSGTSWLPDSSPMFMKMLPKSGRYDLDAMGFITLAENNSGGKRGDSRFFSNSMLMLMSRRETGGGVVGLNLMMSADPIFNGEFGYPDLFQTGETAHGIKLTDYQHPHDLLSELTASYSHSIGKGVGAFLYGGPVGEPALGGPTFMHRPSGAEIPEAPISHHWFDSTHIAWGVLTGGVNTSQWQFEASAFNGHEPNENRYLPDPIELNSTAARVTFNPNRNLSLNASYGFLQSPESTDPGIDQHRITAAAIWNQPLPRGDNLAVTAAFGRNIIQGTNSDALLTEATFSRGPTSVFGRWERVGKDELVGVPAGNYFVNKFLIGGVQDFAHPSGLDLGIGAYAGFYSFPTSLEPFYGKSPVTLGVFLRIRPGRMRHDMSAMAG